MARPSRKSCVRCGIPARSPWRDCWLRCPRPSFQCCAATHHDPLSGSQQEAVISGRWSSPRPSCSISVSFCWCGRLYRYLRPAGACNPEGAIVNLIVFCGSRGAFCRRIVSAAATRLRQGRRRHDADHPFGQSLHQASGLSRGAEPIYPLVPGKAVSDPLVQAMVLTAIVISFGVSACSSASFIGCMWADARSISSTSRFRGAVVQLEEQEVPPEPGIGCCRTGRMMRAVSRQRSAGR